MQVSARIKEMSNAVKWHGGRLFVVGGAVRDWLMGIEPNDLDLMITGMTEQTFFDIWPQAVKALQRQDAPVWIVDGIDLALARREVSTGKGKSGFSFVADATITVEQDLRRRDFTINAMAWDIEAHQLIDPFGGQADIRARMLRPVSLAFVESPERILRAASFAARFDFDIDSRLILLADRMSKDFDTIATDQLWRHFEKGLRKAIKPSRFIGVLVGLGWVDHFPELAAIVNLPQDPEWHPEGDVFTHTQHVMNAAPKGDIVMQLAALCHDMGKASTTVQNDAGRWVSPGHAQAADAANFLAQIGCPNKVREQVLALVNCHMDHIGVTVTKRFVRRLSKRVEPANIEQLTRLMQADHHGRPPLPKITPLNVKAIAQMASEMAIESEPVKPLILGRHLIAMGLKPGKHFGPILDAAFEAQIEGEFDTLEAGLEFVRGLT